VRPRDQLFPEGEGRRHDGLLQLEWSQGWADDFLGLGALLHWLTPRLRELHAEVDYAGAAVMFLQRHRIELGLKTLLDDVGDGPAKYGHHLDKLWGACATALHAIRPEAWEAFADAHHDFVDAVGEVDPGSFAFRYPEDTSGVQSKRPIFVDPVALEAAGAAFEEGVEYWIHLLEALREARDAQESNLLEAE